MKNPFKSKCCIFLFLILLLASGWSFVAWFEYRINNSHPEYDWVKRGYQIKDEVLYVGICSKGECIPREIKNVDINTFSVYENNIHKVYARDKDHVFFRGDIVEEADVESFEVLNGEYDAKDENHFFQRGKVMWTVD